MSVLISESRKDQRHNRSFNWEQVLFWIDEKLGQPISTAWLAEKAHIAPNTLSQKFKKQYKTTLNQYILHRRIDTAKSLLTSSTLTIFEIGQTVGISDPQYFNKQFRKVTGISPSRYREENQASTDLFNSELAIKEGQWNV